MTSTLTTSPWLERRLHGITGTDIAAIMGVHKYRTALDVWAEKTGRTEPDDLSDREDVFWGNRLEEIVLDEYRRRSGRASLVETKWAAEDRELLGLQHNGIAKHMVARRGFEHHLCTPDDVVEEWTPLPWVEEQLELEGPGLVEGKTTNAYSIRDWDDGAPLMHQVQAGYNAAVLGLKWFSVTGLIGGQKHVTYDYPLSDEMAAHLLATATAFWHDHVMADVEPAVTSAVGLEAWKKLHPHDDGTAIELDPMAWEATDRHLVDLKSQRKAIDSEVKDIEARLKGEIGDASTATIGTVCAYTLKEQHRAERVVAAASFRVLRRKKL